MSIGVLSSTLFGDMFGTAAMRGVFGELAFLARCTEAEAALARAQARAGIVPADAAAAISKAAAAIIEDPQSLDLQRLKRETETVGYPILPRGRQLADRGGDAGRWVHWGATTQDIMDTAVVLQIRAGLELIEADLTGLRGHLAALARRWRDTPMAGRTHLQHALPITFGYKAAVWLAAFDRHATRLAELRPRVLQVQFGGAAGTLASLGPGEESLASRAELAREIGVGRAGDHLACRARWDRRDRAVPGLARRQPRQDRLRRHADGRDRVRGSGRAVYRGARLLLDDAAEAQPDLLRIDPRRRQGTAPACRAHSRCAGQRFRARHRPLACRMDRAAGKLRLRRRRTAPGRIHDERPHRRPAAHGEEPRHDARAHRRRGGYDGPRAAPRAQRGARFGLRRLPQGDRERSAAL